MSEQQLHPLQMRAVPEKKPTPTWVKFALWGIIIIGIAVTAIGAYKANISKNGQPAVTTQKGGSAKGHHNVHHPARK